MIVLEQPRRLGTFAAQAGTAVHQLRDEDREDGARPRRVSHTQREDARRSRATRVPLPAQGAGWKGTA